MIAIEPFLHQPAAQAVGWALLHFLWQGALVGAVTALVLATLRGSAADVRYVVATIGLAVMLTMPIVTAVQTWNTARATAQGGYARLNTEGADAASNGLAPGASWLRSNGAARSIGAPAARPVHGTLAAQRSSPARQTVSRIEPVLPVMIMIWIAGVTVLTLRLFTGWFWVQRLRRHGAITAGEDWQRMAARLSRQLHIPRAITLLESVLVEVPTVIGWIKPVVLLPACALGALSPEQLEAILAHEIAHIRRHDYLVNLLQTAVETLLFYHPVVWWLSDRIRAERENCCDDLAVSLCGDPVAYAAALADLESLRGGMGLAMAANGAPLMQRVRRVLGPPTSHAGRGPAWLAGSAAIVLVFGLALGAEGLGQLPATASAQKPDSPAATQPALAAATSTGASPSVAGAGADEPLPGARRRAEAVPLLLHDSQAAPGQASDAQASIAAAAEAAQRARVASRSHEASQSMDAAVAATAQAFESAKRANRADTATLASGQYLTGVALAAVEAKLASLGGTLGQSVSSHQNGSHGNWSWSNDGDKIEVRFDGDFDFTDDDTDVRQMSSGGSLKISDGAWLGRHSVEIRETGGRLEHRYWVNGMERPFEPEGREWLRANLPKFVRNTGIGAEKRVARILKSGGAPAVLTEISRIDGSYVKRIYFSQLFNQATLTPDQYRQVAVQAGRELTSDYELASLLISIADRLPADDASRAAYFEAAGRIKSDYELRRVYSTMLKRGPVNSGILAGILEHAGGIKSDYEQSELLRQVIAQQPLDARTRPIFFKALDTVHSPYERHRVLSAVLARSDGSPDTLAAVLQAGQAIKSDYEAATFLMEVLKQNGVEEAGRVPFFALLDTVQASYERGRVLQAVVRRPNVSKDVVMSALKSARSMSGYDLAQVLLAIAESQTLTGDLRDAYIDAADKLQGYEQGRVMTALVKSERRK